MQALDTLEKLQVLFQEKLDVNEDCTFHRLISKQINHIFLRTSLRILTRKPDHHAELHQTMFRKRDFLPPSISGGGWVGAI